MGNLAGTLRKLSKPAEAAAMQLKCQSLEAAMAQLEVAYRAKVDGITATTEGLVKTLQGERSAADKEITSLRAANAGLPALKQQVVELFQSLKPITVVAH